MTNAEFILRLKKARASLLVNTRVDSLSLVFACRSAGIVWDSGLNNNATFSINGRDTYSYVWLCRQKDFPNYRTAALAVIDNSIAALEKS